MFATNPNLDSSCYNNHSTTTVLGEKYSQRRGPPTPRENFSHPIKVGLQYRILPFPILQVFFIYFNVLFYDDIEEIIVDK